MGFIKAIKRFDTSFDVKLSTYAVPYIIGEIKRFIRDDGTVKVSRSIKELLIKIKDIQKQYFLKNGKEITILELEKILKVSKEEINLSLDSDKSIISINEEVSKQDGISLIDKLEDKKDETNKLTDKIVLKQIIDNLQNRDKQIIMLRFYKDKTQTQVAKILGITQVQVSRLEKRILESMKEELVG